MRITLKQLHVFISVARHGSVTRASEAIGLSQPATSMAISELERLLGERLFDRLEHRLMLNESGRLLLPMAIEVCARINEIETTVGDRASALSGALRIGASSTIGNYLLPRLLNAFITDHPGTQVSLDVENSGKIIQKILNFEIDVGFIEGACHSQEIDTRIWRDDQLTVFCGSQSSLIGHHPPTLEMLAGERWILREKGSGTREKFEQAIAGKLDNLNIFLELGHTEAIKQAVQEGMGISCLSQLAIAKEVAAGVLVPLSTPTLDLRRTFNLIVHKKKYHSRILSRFLTFCS